jgi:hypothetical protein
MEMLFGHLVDFATIDNRQKLILVGIFDIVYVTEGRPIGLPNATLVAKFRASVLEGTQHMIEGRITDADGKDIHPRQHFPVDLAPEVASLGVAANLLAPIGGMPFPDIGDYAFRFYEGDRQLGEIPIHIVHRPAQALPSGASDAPVG